MTFCDNLLKSFNENLKQLTLKRRAGSKMNYRTVGHISET